MKKQQNCPICGKFNKFVVYAFGGRKHFRRDTCVELHAKPLTGEKSSQTSLASHILVLAIVILTICSTSSFAAITQIQNSNVCKSPCWEISGQITKSDLQELAYAVNIMSKKRVSPMFRLNSNGGDVEVAIAIGRQLRKFHAIAVAWDQGGCYSSCVFIFAGAVQRIAGSESIGIHRPYSSSTELRDYKTIQNDQRRLAKIAKDYLEEVNVLPSLYDAMVSIPPEKVKLLSRDELDSYGLVRVDPVEQELWDTADARRRGISMVEFMRRKSQANITCAAFYKYGTQTAHFEDYYRCYEDVLAGRR